MGLIGKIAIILYVVFILIYYYVCRRTIEKQRAEIFTFLREYANELKDFNIRIQKEINELKKQLNK